ncbi:hypothetical protein [Pseudonocardia sp. KRD291]|uniref:COG4315 family predicted lipoprotein n=1 Tax=Pseudonocardia sp. KRD291 TaxID=2792007 RepID=UPI001C4A13B6|nr:hypothetical protein [Pseudonocardia sp. KRD291]MBW0101173.1 hypothetical protein [Pseudonocardia sp. KRD291]
MPAPCTMPAALRLPAALVAALGLLSGCSTDRPATTQPAFTASGADTTLAVTRSTAGLVLADGQGRALYALVPDGVGTAAPACSGPCAQRWPLYAADGVPAAAQGTLNALRTDVIGTVPSAAGGEQVTYAGRQLHRFVGDTAPGSTAGQGTVEFGGTWMLVSPNGDPVRPSGVRP